jgi:hypothetical protein
MEAIQVRLIENIEGWFDLIDILIDSLEGPTKSSISELLESTRELFLTAPLGELIEKLKSMPNLIELELHDALRCFVDLLDVEEFHFDVFSNFIEQHTETKQVACTLISQLDNIRIEVLNM